MGTYLGFTAPCRAHDQQLGNSNAILLQRLQRTALSCCSARISSVVCWSLGQFTYEFGASYASREYYVKKIFVVYGGRQRTVQNSSKVSWRHRILQFPLTSLAWSHCSSDPPGGQCLVF